uniref:Uncharacterized protein n=1 Tax=virus sp. ctviY17 TaxID=2825828 RepID=A0A8S5RMY0_9VIRU|nr:MAG TPA: hypothetical protein [virus sp. ctviY17]
MLNIIYHFLQIVSIQNLQLLEYFILHPVCNMLQYRCGGISYDKL